MAKSLFSLVLSMAVPATAALLGFGSASHAAVGTIVSVQFPQYYGEDETHTGIVTPLNAWGGFPSAPPDSNYTAGVAGSTHVKNWNVAATSVTNVNSPSLAGTITKAQLVNGGGFYTNADLKDSTGAAVSGLNFSLTYSANDHTDAHNFPGAIWYQPDGGEADAYLAAGIAFTTNSAAKPVSLTVNGLNQNATYSLIAYVGSPWWGGEPTGTVSLGATTLNLHVSNNLAAWTQVTADNAVGNYVKFDGLTGQTAQTIALSGNYIGFSGFQLVQTAEAAAVPEPTTIGLIGLGSLGLLVRRRRTA